MTTVNGTLLKSRFNDSDISVTNAEIIIDATIDTLNLNLHTALSNLSGVAGSKTGTYTSAQTGGIFALALLIYREMFKHAEGSTGQIGALSQSYTPSLQILNYAEKIARQLNRATEDAPLYVSNDPVPTE